MCGNIHHIQCHLYVHFSKEFSCAKKEGKKRNERVYMFKVPFEITCWKFEHSQW